MDNNEIYVGKGTEGFHVLYIWALIQVALIYGHLPIIAWVDHVFGEDDSTAHLIAACIPLMLLLVNIFIVIFAFKKTDRRIFLGCSVLIKYILVPLYVFGAFVICIFLLMMFTPVVIMVFVSPIITTVLTVYGWVVVVSVAPFTIAYLLKAKKEGKLPGFIVKACIVSQFFFMADVIVVMLLAILRERRWVKLTAVLLTIVMLGVIAASLFIGINIARALL